MYTFRFNAHCQAGLKAQRRAPLYVLFVPECKKTQKKTKVINMVLKKNIHGVPSKESDQTVQVKTENE